MEEHLVAFLILMVLVVTPMAVTFLIKRTIAKKDCQEFDSKAIFLVFLAVSLGLFLFGVIINFHLVTDSFNAKFSREVNLHQVTVKGEQSFNVQIAIKYKDGKIVQLDLIEGTTVLDKKDESEGTNNDD